MHGKEHDCLSQRHLTRWQGAAAGALNPGIDIAVENVIDGATGPAHDHGTDGEQQCIPELDRLRHRAGQHQ